MSQIHKQCVPDTPESRSSAAEHCLCAGEAGGQGALRAMQHAAGLTCTQ